MIFGAWHRGVSCYFYQARRPYLTAEILHHKPYKESAILFTCLREMAAADNVFLRKMSLSADKGNLLYSIEVIIIIGQSGAALSFWQSKCCREADHGEASGEEVRCQRRKIIRKIEERRLSERDTMATLLWLFLGANFKSASYPKA